MARRPRLQFEGAMYHITTRGNRRELIVNDEMDYKMLQKTLLEAISWAGVWLFAWCLMPNHVHALIETVEANAAAFMQRWLTRYAQYFNWRHKLVGHVFQGRYNAKLVQRETYFKELIRYIHLNPYRVDTPGFVGPEGWPWSSHRYYLGEAAPPECQTAIDRGLSMFGSTPAQARQAYAQFLADGLRDGNWEDFYENAQDDILGDEAFVKRHSVVPSVFAPVPMRRVTEKWSLEDVLAAAERAFGVERHHLADPRQTRDLSRIRQAIALVTRRSAGITISEVAKAFGRDPSAISQMLRRTEARLEEIIEVERLLNELAKVNVLEMSDCQA